MKHIRFIITMMVLAMMQTLAIQTRHNDTAVVVSTHLGAGFFAALHSVVDSLLHFDNDPAIRSFVVDWTLSLFPFKDDPASNGWNLFFEPITWPNQSYNCSQSIHVRQGYHKLHDQRCSDIWTKYEEYLTYRISAHNIICKYLKLQPHIARQAQELYSEHLTDHYCIGVHVRYATVHGLEVPGGNVPELEDYYAQIDGLLAQPHEKPVKIYLATDSWLVIQAFAQRYPATILVYLPDAYRSIARNDPHLIFENTEYWVENPEQFHECKPGSRGGFESLIDCLMLSTCDIFIHTTSNLAAFATYFNPHIKSIYLPLNTPSNPCRYKYVKQAGDEPITYQKHLELS